MIKRGAGQAGHLRRDAGGLQGTFARLRFFDARDDGLAGGGQLINAVRSVDDEGSFGSERSQRTPDKEHLAGREHADYLCSRAGRIGQRAAQVENGAEAQRAAERA